LPSAITDRPVPTITSAFRVVTANLRGHSGGDTAPSNVEDIWDISSDYWSNATKQAQYPRRRILRETILAQHAGIYCFQECSMQQVRDFLDVMPGYAAFKYPRTTTSSGQFESDSGEAILYSTEHFELLDQDHFWLTPDPRTERIHPAITSSRDANWARLKDKQTGREFVVWFTHLQHGAADAENYTGGNNEARLFEMKMILNAAALNPPDLPQFLFGDFNVGYTDTVVQTAVAAGWRDTYTEAYGNSNPGRTHHDFGSITTAGTKIDFVLVRGPLKTHGAEVIKDYETIANTDRYPSDHYFVSAVVSFDTTVPAATAASALATTDTIVFGAPAGLALDTAGTLYVADESNHAIYKNAAPYAESYILAAPRALALQDNFLYVADSDNRAIRLIDTTAGTPSLTLYSGDPAGAPGATDGPAATATYALPAAIAVAPDGALYVADSTAHAIRKIAAATGEVSTLAGTLGTAGHANGPGPAALFREPLGLALSHDAQTLYVADTGNHAIRAIDLATVEVTTPAGTPGFAGWGDGAGAASRFNLPAALAASAATLYVADAGNHAIRAIDLATNSVTRLAGIPGRTLPVDGHILYAADGGPDDVIFNNPTGLALDATAQTLYVADTGNGVIRKIALDTRQTTTLYAASRIGDQYKLTASNTTAPSTPPSTDNASSTTTISGAPATGDIGGGAPSFPALALLTLLLLRRRQE
jgi:DNA-binding beta-propeller fold protein YncE/endonuclease/exonuclease/phosphatase family metal-dependent hydrolase